MSQSTNPANAPEKTVAGHTRIPMSLPVLKLAVQDIPGYHLHWMRGDPARIHQAQKAGYEFVSSDEIDVVNTNLAEDASESGNTDLGSRVSVSSGSDHDESGQPGRLFLMKIRNEWWEEDQKGLGDKNEQLAATLRGDGNVENGYIPSSHQKSVKNMFHKKS